MLDDAFHYLRLNGLSGNHSTDIPHRSTMCKDNTPTDVQDIESAEPGWVSIHKRPENSPKLLVWSTADEKGVSRLQKAWESWLPPNAKLHDLQNGLLDHLAYTLASRRTLLSWRTFAVSSPSDSWATISDKFSLTSQARISPNLVMIFSGVCSNLYHSERGDANITAARSAVVCNGSSAVGCLPSVFAECRTSG